MLDTILPPRVPRVGTAARSAGADRRASACPDRAAAATATLKGLAVVSASKNALGLSWGAVKGATTYTVKYSTAKSMKGSKSTTSAKPAAEPHQAQGDDDPRGHGAATA